MNFADEIGKPATAIRRKVLVDSRGGEKVDIVGNDFFRFRAVEIISDERGNSFRNDGIGIDIDTANSVFKTAHEPELRCATLDQIRGNALPGIKHGRGFRAVDQVLKAILRIFKGLEFRKDFIVFFF